MFDCCLPMKIMKLVMKKPIQTHVITGTFWRVENLIFKCKQCNLKNAASVRTFFCETFCLFTDLVDLFPFPINAMYRNQSKKGPQEKQIQGRQTDRDERSYPQNPIYANISMWTSLSLHWHRNWVSHFVVSFWQRYHPWWILVKLNLPRPIFLNVLWSNNRLSS